MSERDPNREREIAGRAQQLFAGSTAGLDGHTRSRLARARAAAVAAAGSQRRYGWLLPSRLLSPGGVAARLVPLGGVAAALLVVALSWQVLDAPVAPAASVVLNDLDLLLEGENIDLFEELEFYAWLLEQPELLEAEESGDGSG
jgi:hypothetical protein